MRPLSSVRLLALMALLPLAAACDDTGKADDSAGEDGGDGTDGADGTDGGDEGGDDGGDEGSDEGGDEGGDDGGDDGGEAGWTTGPELSACTPQDNPESSIVTLMGVVLTLDGPVAGGLSYDRATGLITAVGDVTPGDETVVCTEGVISPGLIDAHNHLQYNVTPPWQHGMVFEDRYDWRASREYDDYRTAYDRIDDEYRCEIMKWAELRVLVGGGTSAVGASGDSCINVLVRNLDEPYSAHGFDDYDLWYSSSTVTSSYDAGDGYDVTAELASGELSAMLNHVAEGVNGSVSDEIDHMHDVGLSGPGQAFVHATDADAGQLARMAGEGTSIVWAPRSNLDLYQRTTPADVALRMGVPVALGPDWTWSGSMNPAREMTCAHEYLGARKAPVPEGYEEWDQKLFEMATVDAAMAVGLEGLTGSLEVGHAADISVFSFSRSPYKPVVQGDPADVRLVIIDGDALYGVPELVDQLSSLADWCETIEPCGGEARKVCVQAGESGDDSQTLADVQATLEAALAGIDMPSGYEYAGMLHGLFYCDDTRVSCDPRAIEDGDLDGDGVADADDGCPESWDPDQFDYDRDGEGDACDVCPLNPEGETCNSTADDWDGDGVLNDEDGCPTIYDPDPVDDDGDGIGDACDQCLGVANPGNGPCPVTITAIRNPADPDHPADGAGVTVIDAVVTAIGPSGFHIQDPAVGAEGYGGVYVYTSSSGLPSGLEVGDQVTVAGTHEIYYDLTEIANPTVTVTGTATVPDPLLVSPCDIGTGGSMAEAYESMLVRVESVEVTDENPDAGDGGDYGEMEVDSCLRIDDDMYASYDRTVGTRYDSIQGPLHYAFSNAKLRPRSADDVVVEE